MNRFGRGFVKLAAIVAMALACFGTQQAHAGMVPTYPDSPVVTVEGSDYRWTYDILLFSPGPGNPQVIASGDFFTIYDIAGLVAGSATGPSGWTATQQTPGITPDGISPTDGPLPNLTWTYSGSPLSGDPGSFSFLSEYYGLNYVPRNFAAQTSYSSDNSLKDQNVTTVAVPAPEPATLTMLGIGLPLLGAYRLTRRKAKVV